MPPKAPALAPALAGRPHFQAIGTMLEFFRKMTKSTIGAGIALLVLVLIAFAFAGGDIANSGGFGGVAGGDRVATVGERRISTSALSQAVSARLEDLKQQQPKLTMALLLKAGGLDNVLDELLDRNAIAAFGEAHGVIASDRLVDSEIAQIPAFRGPDGKFSEDAYRQMLQQRGLKDAMVREDLANGLIARQLLVPAAFGATMPRELALRYTALLKEKRGGAIALLPSLAFVPRTPPTDAELSAYYGKNRDNYTRPERRRIRFASFGEEALKNVPGPTEPEVAARYAANKAQYAASESRKLTQLILPTEAAARVVLAEVKGGKSLEATASAKGLSAASIGSLDRGKLIEQFSPAVADAVYSAASGSIAGPVRSPLGWHLMRIDAIEVKPARSLEQVRAELTTELAAAKRRAALIDFTTRIEDEFDNGSTLADVAKDLGVTFTETVPVTADGAVYGKQGETAPPILARVIQTAFAMEAENQPQLAEIEAGKTFLVYDVTDITASAPAPLAEIKGDVTTDLLLEKGSVAAKAAAEKIQAAVRKGTDLGAAMASLGVALPPVDRVEMGREELTARQQQVPPPLALLFSMAEGTTKTLAGPRNRGWYVVSLKDIVPGVVDPKDPLIAVAQRELGQVAGREYADQLRRAIRADVGVKRNETAIKAVSTQLTGGN